MFLSRDMQEFLADNQLSLDEMLRRQGADVQIKLGQDPAASSDAGHKEPATIIIASAAVIAALTPLLIKAFETLAYKPVVVTEQVIVPVEDSKGNVVLDANGNPVLHWVDRTRVIETDTRPRDETSVDIKGPLGISIGYKSRPKE